MFLLRQLEHRRWYQTFLKLVYFLIPACTIGILLRQEWLVPLGVILSLAVAMLIFHLSVVITQNRIDTRLTEGLGYSALRGFRTFTKNFPSYRFVDLFRAVDRYAKRHAVHQVVESHHDVDLNTIVNGRFYNADQARIKAPSKVLKDIAWKKEEFFPTDQFWAVSDGLPGGFKAILRVKISDYTRDILLEIATPEGVRAEDITEELIRDGIAHSIYKNALLQVSFDAGIKDEFGDVEGGGEVHLAFKQENTISDQDIVLEDEIHRMLERNIFDFHRMRDRLKAYGIPCKKGILFYGPPGTGKTYTCQYIYSNLKPVTTLVVTGQSLLQVKSICNLARMLQPSLLVLEDVDLIFSSREINLYSTALGDLMDELDGFQSDESVTFLLTTNAIERLEEAIKDRPGRINQCIYFGHPNPELRRRYIACYLRPYNSDKVDLDHVVRKTGGSSQAFIKELIYRAVQVSLEGPSTNGQGVYLKTEDFDIALDEMTKFNEQAAGSIMGFRVDH